ncbi:MAG: hypothetical protein WC475_03240 [Candidatus Paceibacterota bacterium]
MVKEKEGKAGSIPNNSMNLLLENSIALQKMLADLAFNLKDLNKKITNMLELFENASRNMKESPSSEGLSEKVEELSKQNKTIAKGLLLLEKSMREKEDKHESGPRPLPTI